MCFAEGQGCLDASRIHRQGCCQYFVNSHRVSHWYKHIFRTRAADYPMIYWDTVARYMIRGGGGHSYEPKVDRDN